MNDVTSNDASRSARILVVDDDDDVRALLGHLLRHPDHEIAAAGSASQARALLLGNPFDLVITDLVMPFEDGLSLMRWGRKLRPETSWIVLTGHGDFGRAVDALRLGAFDFLPKTGLRREALMQVVRNSLGQRRLLEERDRLHRELAASNACLRAHVGQLAEACALLRQQAEVIREDLQRASVIQRGLLPRVPPEIPGFHVRGHYRPSRGVGGDVYDVLPLDERYLVMLIANAAGHGLAAAMLAVLFRSRIPFLDPETGAPESPRAALRFVNRSLVETLPERGLFLTGAYGLLDTSTGALRVASAGHPPLVCLRRDGALEQIHHTGPALGLYPESDFAETQLQLEPGDRLLLYSDGLYQQLPPRVADRCDAVTTFLREGGPAALERLLGLASEAETNDDDVTALVLTAGPGTSLLDNGAPCLHVPDVRAPRPSRAWVGSDAARKSLSIQGCADWRFAPAIYEECRAAIDEGAGVMLDFALCESLDSTVLGTIHRLCQLAEEADVEFRIQNASPRIEALFEELGMEAVVAHMLPNLLPLPREMAAIPDEGPGGAVDAELVLRAHEAIVALNERNRQEFGPLLAQLREEMADRSS